jgi:DNA polymerase III alpha subunit (gram-positive type)
MLATVFDCETTGLIINPARKLDIQPEIISLAIQDVDLKAGVITDSYYQEFKPLKPVSEEITRITKITNERLRNAHSMFFELPIIISKFSSAPMLIGQNIKFDMDMIELECQRYNWPKFKWPTAIDLIQHTIHLKGYRLSLTNLHKELFGAEFASAHDASVDCTITAKCAIELFKRGLL